MTDSDFVAALFSSLLFTANFLVLIYIGFTSKRGATPAARGRWFMLIYGFAAPVAFVVGLAAVVDGWDSVAWGARQPAVQVSVLGLLAAISHRGALLGKAVDVGSRAAWFVGAQQTFLAWLTGLVSMCTGGVALYWLIERSGDPGALVGMIFGSFYYGGWVFLVYLAAPLVALGAICGWHLARRSPTS